MNATISEDDGLEWLWDRVQARGDLLSDDSAFESKERAAVAKSDAQILLNKDPTTAQLWELYNAVFRNAEE